MPPSDTEIDHTALSLMSLQGANVRAYASVRRSHAATHGDDDAVAQWDRVIAAVMRLELQRRPTTLQ